jgi:hypothetical protein
LKEAKPVKRQVSQTRVLPGLRQLAQGQAGRITVASAPYRPTGLVVDYHLVRTTPNFTFASGQTYHVSGELYLSGTTTVEAGAVIKLGPSSSIQVLGAFQSPARTAYLTAEDDGSVGVPIAGRRGAESYGAPALSFYQLEEGTVIRNLEIRYAQVGIENHSPQAAHTVEASRFFKCQTAVAAYGATVNLRQLNLEEVGQVERHLGGGARFLQENNITKQSSRRPSRPVSLQYDHGGSTSSATGMGTSDSRSG